MKRSRYEVKVRGRVTRSLAAEFEQLDLRVAVQPVQTVLHGAFADQSALHGLLRHIEGLGLELVEVRRLVVDDEAPI